MRVVLITVCLIIMSCGGKTSFLSVGDAHISPEEFNKKYTDFLNLYRSKYNSEAPADSIEVWLDEYVNSLYILADAYDKGYEDNERVKYYEDWSIEIILAQQYGLVWEELVESRVEVSEEEVDEVIRMGGTCFELDVQHIDEKNDNDSFDVDNNLNASQSKTMVTRFPFNELYSCRYQIYEMETGDVVFDQDKHLKVICVQKNPGYWNMSHYKRDDIKQSLISLKMMIKEQELNAEIEKTSCLSVTDRTVAMLLDYAEEKGLAMDGKIRHELPGGLRETTICSYLIGKKKVTLSVGEMLQKYDRLIFKVELTSRNNFLLALKQIVQADYYMHYAIDSGLMQSPDIQLRRSLFRHFRMRETYVHDFIDSSILVDEKEMMDYYSVHPGLFTEPTSVEAILISSEINKDLFEVRSLLSKNGYDYELLESCKASFEHCCVVVTKNDLEVPQQAMSVFFDSGIPYGSHTMVFDGEGYQYFYIKLGAIEKRNKTYDDAKSNIKMMLFNKEKQDVRFAHISKLKGRYSLHCNVACKNIDPAVKSILMNYCGRSDL